MVWIGLGCIHFLFHISTAWSNSAYLGWADTLNCKIIIFLLLLLFFIWLKIKKNLDFYKFYILPFILSSQTGLKLFSFLDFLRSMNIQFDLKLLFIITLLMKNFLCHPEWAWGYLNLFPFFHWMQSVLVSLNFHCKHILFIGINAYINEKVLLPGIQSLQIARLHDI